MAADADIRRMTPRPRPRRSRDLESIMRHDHLVTVSLRMDQAETSVDVTADAFLRGVDALRRGDIYELRLGEHVRVRMPRPVAREMALDLLHLLDWEDRLMVLRAVEERMA